MPEVPERRPISGRHVLLRHRPLRQPHGFEGLSTPGRPVLVHPDDLAGADGEDHVRHGFESHPARAASATDAYAGDDVISRVDQFLGLGVQIVPAFLSAAERSKNPIHVARFEKSLQARTHGAC
jgi:hypothetical protein